MSTYEYSGVFCASRHHQHERRKVAAEHRCGTPVGCSRSRRTIHRRSDHDVGQCQIGEVPVSREAVEPIDIRHSLECPCACTRSESDDTPPARGAVHARDRRPRPAVRDRARRVRTPGSNSDVRRSGLGIFICLRWSNKLRVPVALPHGARRSHFTVDGELVNIARLHHRRLPVLIGASLLLATSLVALNASPSQALAAPAADVALVQAMFNTGRLTAGADAQGEPLASLQAYAAGSISAHAPDNTTLYCTLDHVVLQGLYEVVVNRGFSIHVTSINRLCELPLSNKPSYYSLHWENGGGHAVDVTAINGQATGSNTALVQSYLNIMASVMPAAKTGLGQPSCWPGLTVPAGWFVVGDNCSSVHIEYRGSSTEILPTPGSSFDDNNDGHDDFFAANSTTGMLTLYEGNGGGYFPNSHDIGTGWNARVLATPSDFNNDGQADILATRADGALEFYPGNGAQGFSGVSSPGAGWQSMTKIASGADYTGDHLQDIIGVSSAGMLYVYAGNGTGSTSATYQVGPGWQNYKYIVGGDFNGDGKGDMMVVSNAGDLYFYRGTGLASFAAGQLIGGGWGSFTALTGGGDYNGDGKADLLARSATGDLYLYRGNGTGSTNGSQLVGPGWGGYTFIL